YSFNWTNVAAGNYTLTAKAIGSNGTSTTSAPIAIVVTAPAAPTVNITAPANNASFVAPASVTINANATTTQGTVTQVEFYNGATLLNSDTTAPYSFNWANVAAGNYTLTAKAIGSNGLSTTSAAVSILVNPPASAPVPVLRWPLDAVTAGVTPDLSPVSNPGTVIGPYTLSPGMIGQGIQLDPASGAIRSQSQAISADQSFTVSTWVKLANTSGTQTFISQSAANVSNFYLQLGGWLRGRFTFDLYPTDSTNASDKYVDGTTQPQAGVWYHIAGVYDSAAGKIRIYVNGAMEGETTSQ
ncbi:MAG: LamG domain-containing protein, partial [Acidobacteria bacterium]|nr:LamG domain-containing protein [Acidobacteriota bacterium]